MRDVNLLTALAAALLGPALNAAGPTVVIEYERDATAWLAAAPGAEARAFDEFVPGIVDGAGCIAGPPSVILPLAGGTVTVTGLEPGGSDDYCLLRDGSTVNGAVSDGNLDQGATLKLTFDPPVGAFYTYYGSLPEEETVSMALYAGDVLIDTLVSAPSPLAGMATGHGFVSSVPIYQVVFTSAAPGTSLVGAFTFLAPGEPSLGSVEIPGYQGPDGSTVNLDFACVFGPIVRVHNATQDTDHFMIGDAIASADDGDELVAQPFIFAEAVDFMGKAVTLRGVDPDDPVVVEHTIIHADGLAASGVTCRSGEGADTVLDGLTIRYGEGTDVDGTTRGGGMYVSAASPTVRRCRFVSNVADEGGGMYTGEGANPIVTACTFESNAAIFGGGGMYNDASSPAVDGCVFAENVLEIGDGGGMANVNGSTPTVTDCRFERNGSGAYFGGGMANDASSPIVERCTFADNEAFLAGGGMACTNGSNAVLESCTFELNESDSGGGLSSDGSTVAATNCVFFWNHAIRGGGMFNQASTVVVTNCSFAWNVAFYGGGGSVANQFSIVRIDNSILVDSDAAVEIDDVSSTTTVSHSNVAGGWAGIGNIDADPMYVDASIGDLRPMFGAPGTDAGDNGAPGLVAVTSDRDGSDRFVNDPNAPDCPYVPGTCGDAPIVDMGAYELVVPCPADVTGDGSVGFPDLLGVLAAWGSCSGCPEDIDGDGVVGFTDLLLVLSAWGACP